MWLDESIPTVCTFQIALIPFMAGLGHSSLVGRLVVILVSQIDNKSLEEENTKAVNDKLEEGDARGIGGRRESVGGRG